MSPQPVDARAYRDQLRGECRRLSDQADSGSVFSLFGINRGRRTLSLPLAVHIPTTLGGSSIALTPVGGGAVINARVYYSLNIAVAGRLPCTIPLRVYAKCG